MYQMQVFGAIVSCKFDMQICYLSLRYNCEIQL